VSLCWQGRDKPERGDQMDEYYRNRLGMSFSMKRGSFIIYWAAIRKIGNPNDIQLLMNQKGKRIALLPSNPLERDHLQLPDNKQIQCELCGIRFIRKVYELCDWDPEKNYRVFGRFYEKDRIIEYRLEEAVEIPDSDYCDEDLRA
jgi:hypothetical protein